METGYENGASTHALFLAGHEVLSGLREASEARGVKP